MLVSQPQSLFDALEWKADPWQLDILQTRVRQRLILVPRQCGKSLVAAAKALIMAMSRPRSLSVIISRSQNQAAEVLLKVKILYNAYAERRREKLQVWKPTLLGKPVDDEDDDTIADEVLERLEGFATSVRDNVLRKEFSNGSRVITMACKGETSVGSTTDLLILDEAARMPDTVYYSVRPTLAIAQSAGRGELLALSTPFGKRGWFWEGWKNCEEAKVERQEPEWTQTSICVEQCPRIKPEFLQREYAAMGEFWFRQEYGKDGHPPEFRDAIDAVFSSEDVDRALVPSVGRLFEEC